MNPLAEIMEQMGKNSEQKAISGNEREAVREKFVHIADLKEGDKVQWKRGFKSARFPDYDITCEVFRVYPIQTRSPEGSNHDLDENDFSILVKTNGTFYEFAFDSRRFERVE